MHYGAAPLGSACWLGYPQFNLSVTFRVTRRRGGESMRRSVILLVLLAGLLLPATTAAASPYRSSVLKNVCATSGGSAGFGYVRLKVRAEEVGVSGVNYFVFKAALQKFSGGVWTTTDRTKAKSPTFADDSTSWTQDYRAQSSFASASHAPTRIIVRVLFWDQRPGDDALLASHTHISTTC